MFLYFFCCLSFTCLGMENPYQNMLVHDPALFHELIKALNLPPTPQLGDGQLSTQAGKAYICPECKKGFKNCFGYKIHLQDHTGKKKYKCEKCPYETNNSSNFGRHKARATSCLHKSGKKRNNESKKPFI